MQPKVGRETGLITPDASLTLAEQGEVEKAVYFSARLYYIIVYLNFIMLKILICDLETARREMKQIRWVN